MNTYPPVARLVPHAPPLLALDELIDWSPGRSVCRLVLREDGPFARDGRIEGVWALEFMAQAVAACLGYEATREGHAIRVGMIVACRSLHLDRPTLPPGVELTVVAERQRGSHDASLFETRLLHGDERLARAVLTLVHRDAPQP